MMSKKPNKQRKAVYEMKLHLLSRNVKCILSKPLRKSEKKRNTTVRTGDKVKIMRGSNKGKSGKVVSLNRKRGFVYIENISRKKADGKEVQLPFRASNLMIIELTEKRAAGAEKKTKAAEKKEKPHDHDHDHEKDHKDEETEE